MVDSRFIIMVQDDPFVMQIQENILDRSKEQYITAEDGIEAYKKFEEQDGKITLVLMNILMPNMNGFESAKKIREKERIKGYRKCKIYAVSSDTCFEEEAIEAGMDGFILSPLNNSKFNEII